METATDDVTTPVADVGEVTATPANDAGTAVPEPTATVVEDPASTPLAGSEVTPERPATTPSAPDAAGGGEPSVETPDGTVVDGPASGAGADRTVPGPVDQVASDVETVVESSGGAASGDVSVETDASVGADGASGTVRTDVDVAATVGDSRTRIRTAVRIGTPTPIDLADPASGSDSGASTPSDGVDPIGSGEDGATPSGPEAGSTPSMGPEPGAGPGDTGTDDTGDGAPPAATPVDGPGGGSDGTVGVDAPDGDRSGDAPDPDSGGVGGAPSDGADDDPGTGDASDAAGGNGATAGADRDPGSTAGSDDTTGTSGLFEAVEPVRGGAGGPGGTGDSAERGDEPTVAGEANGNRGAAPGTLVGAVLDGARRAGRHLPGDPLTRAIVGLGTVLAGGIALRSTTAAHLFPGRPSASSLRARARRTLSGARRWVDSKRPFLPPFPGYSRHDDSDPLADENRADLYETVTASPGVYLSELAEETGLPLSTARYHLRVLREEDVVKAAKIRGKRRFYPVDYGDLEYAAALENETTAALLDAIARHEPATVSELSEDLGRAPSTISYHLGRLEEDGLIDRERTGESVATRLKPALRRAFTGEQSTAAD